MKSIRCALRTGVALGVVGATCSPVLADEINSTSVQPPLEQTPGANDAEISEQQQYVLRLMMQIYDGQNDFSHTQLLGVGRIRNGDQSFTQFDFGDGSVVITQDGGKMAAGRFLNVTGVEQGHLYDYRTKSIGGSSKVALYHNSIIRPLLGKSPDLGRNASWNAQVALASLGAENDSGGIVKIALSREYFVHDGKPMVLIHYAIPAFTYDNESGKAVAQWGSGLSLTDPGFGMIYLNTAVHRAVAQTDSSGSVPYRFARNMVAANADGTAMIDYRTIPQLAKYHDEFFSQDAMMVVPTGAQSLDALPIQLARNLDLIGLSIAEDGANEAGIAAGAQGSGGRGKEETSPSGGTGGGRTYPAGWDPSLSDFGLVNAGASTLYEWAKVAPDSDLETKIFYEISGELTAFKAASNSLGAELVTAQSNYDTLKKAADNRPGNWVNSPRTQQLADADKAAKAARIAAKDAFLAAVREPHSANKTARMAAAKAEFDAARAAAGKASRAYTAVVGTEGSLVFVQPDLPKAQMGQINAARDALEDVGARLAEQEAKGIKLALKIQEIPPTRATKFKASLGKGLKRLGVAFNLYSTATGISNLRQLNKNLGYGAQPKLSRTYGSALDGTGVTFAGVFDIGLGFDLIGLASSDRFTAAAVTVTSISDLVVAGKAKLDIDQVNQDARRKGIELIRRQAEQERRIREEETAQWETEIATLDNEIKKLRDESPEYDEALRERMAERGIEPHTPNDPNWTNPNIDQETGLPKPAYWAHLKEKYPNRLITFGIDPEAPVGGWPGGVGPEHRPVAAKKPPKIVVVEVRPDFGEPGYPTAPPRDPKTKEPEEETGPITTILSDEELAEIDREQRRQEAQAELEAYQAEKLAERRAKEEAEANEPGSSEYRVSTLETSELVVSGFDIKPVTFTPPTWKPPEWKPPEWVPPEFTPPVVSQIPPTDPKDSDGYPGTGQYPAFGFDNMSGVVATDLGPWMEWLNGQDIRLLTQLALQAGYPNLASALADAENIIRLSQNSGYRQWSFRAPSCGGIVGCGPSYLERWSMKRSIVSLGDILVKSRGIFSSGGFTDIGISGFNLMYMLRDFGIQDGDLIDVEISQFGRVVGKLEGHFLLTAGSPFNVQLQPGVSQMVISALNEGSASPNTAEVTIQNVVRGDGTQTYSLKTGETAVLRIEAGASADTSRPSSGNGIQGTSTAPSTNAPATAASQRPQAVPPSVPPTRIPPSPNRVRGNSIPNIQ